MRLRLLLVMLLALVLHVAVLPDLHPVRPDAMLLLAVAGGLALGPERGAVFGFACGLVADLFVTAPLALSALAFSVAAYTVGILNAGILRSAPWIAPLIAFGGTAGGLALYAVAGALVGHPEMLDPALVPVLAATTIANALLSPLAVRLLQWALPTAEPAYIA